MKKTKVLLLKMLKMIALPVAVYVLFMVICRLAGADKFGIETDLMAIFRNTVLTGMIALAVSYNLTSGRFDFSVGATLVLATIMGGSLALRFGLDPVSMLLLCMLFGAILGFVGGFVYVALRLPPMVVSLGIAMVYEAIGFMISNSEGVSFNNRNDMLIWAQSPYIFILCIVVVIILYILLNKTKFGYNTNSLRKGQEIAVVTGINEKTNTIICYVIAGALLAAAGVIKLSLVGTVQAESGLSSIAYIQNAFLPMFIGNILAKYGDRNTGVIMGSLTQAIITSAFGALGIPSSGQNILNGLIVICFFAYSYNSYRIVEFGMFERKRAHAEKAINNEKSAN